MKPWFFSFTFALSTVTVVSGCLAERTSLIAYPLMTTVVTSFVFSVASHWVWSDSGWLKNLNSDCIYLDFAGGTVVHAVGESQQLQSVSACLKLVRLSPLIPPVRLHIFLHRRADGPDWCCAMWASHWTLP